MFFLWVLGDIVGVDFVVACDNMIEGQLRTNRIVQEKLLSAFRKVPRENFVNKHSQASAYSDGVIPLSSSRFLMSPLSFAQLIQLADIQSTDIVLDIGFGTGYSSAVLSHLSATVIALENDPALCQRANASLSTLMIDNVAIVQGDLRHGLPEQAPYNVIILEGAVEEVPDQLVYQLADQGRLVTVLCDHEKSDYGTAILVQRQGQTIISRKIFDSAVPILPEFLKKKLFEFS